ncbi:hypothetical protein HDE_03910 [Halotydeus destructor]|nr:hypothetical protein HDE_03910 [Halotydeus destructor]
MNQINLILLLLIFDYTLCADNEQGKLQKGPHDTQYIPWELCDKKAQFGKFCFGGVGNVTSFPGGRGCWKDRSCTFMVIGELGEPPGEGRGTYYCVWNIYYVQDHYHDKGDVIRDFFLNKSPNNTLTSVPDFTMFIRMKHQDHRTTTGTHYYRSAYCRTTIRDSTGVSYPDCTGTQVFTKRGDPTTYDYELDGKRWTWFQFSSQEQLVNSHYKVHFFKDALQPYMIRTYAAKIDQILRTDGAIDVFHRGESPATVEPDYEDETTTEAETEASTTVSEETEEPVTEEPVTTPEPETEANTVVAQEEQEKKGFNWLWLLLLIPLVLLIFFFTRRGKKKTDDGFNKNGLNSNLRSNLPSGLRSGTSSTAGGAGFASNFGGGGNANSALRSTYTAGNSAVGSSFVDNRSTFSPSKSEMSSQVSGGFKPQKNASAIKSKL